jgi:hypothetical protein
MQKLWAEMWFCPMFLPEHYEIETGFRQARLLGRSSRAWSWNDMISGRPPGRLATLFTAWADWLFAKLSPPEPAPTQRTLPPKLVKSDREAGTAKTAARR